MQETTRLSLDNVADSLDKFSARKLPQAQAAMSVADVQRALTQIGFFPGGAADGICGYRTLSAIRLFQEYVRTVEGHDLVPNGVCDAETQAHLQRWLASGAQPDWRPEPGEYEAWLALLENVKQHHLTTPSRVIEMVNAYQDRSDTRKVADWDFTGPGNIHLIGVRRFESARKYDDIFVLLINGLVFKFQGSTEPGVTSNRAGPPHIVPGQHNYHFGWHPGAVNLETPVVHRYLALRPLSSGVLTVRGEVDRPLNDADLAKGLEKNASINIHWGGRGMLRNNDWSEGCQVLNSLVYINPANELVSCEKYAATFKREPLTDRDKTRGAYNVLVDLVTALSGDLPSNQVKYTMLMEADLALAPALKQKLDADRDRALTIRG